MRCASCGYQVGWSQRDKCMCCGRAIHEKDYCARVIILPWNNNWVMLCTQCEPEFNEDFL